MDHLTPYSVSSILAAISNIAMAIFSFQNSKKRPSIRMWGFFCLLASIWCIGSTIFTSTNSKEFGFIGWRIAYLSVIVTPTVFYNFVFIYTRDNSFQTLRIIYFYTLLLISVALFMPKLLIEELYFINNQYYFINIVKTHTYLGWIVYIFSYWLLQPYTFIKLINYFKNQTGLEKLRSKYLILGTALAWLGPHLLYLINFGVNISLHVNLLIAVCPIIIGYAIIRHQLLDIEIIIKKSLVYSILISLITAAYFIMVIIIERVSQEFLGYKSFLLSIIFATIITLAFIPLKNMIKNIVDKNFLKGTPIEIANENDLLRQEVAQKEKFRIIANMAAGIAHEVKNPLTAIKAFTDYLPAKKNDPEFLEKFSRIVSHETDRINNLVHELLDFAKPSPPRFQPACVDKIIEEVLDLVSNQIVKNNIKVTQSLTTSHYALNIDVNQIKQALINIIQNAIEAMPNGGDLTITTFIPSHPLPVTRHPSLVTSNTNDGQLRTGDQAVIISIKDTGGGIPKDALPHIFEPFFSQKQGGTGLGLAVTQGIIREHKGTIKVNSQTGQGTEFIIGL